ncbi:hypothetical protein [Ramlibacter sp.]|uniref:DUF7706 family protein n=1 Tax=Ramlibacter sp. TaxID=1917967 RepID=UPI0017D0CEC0|nr:hypothetical protein [Ramlibacter sp.]MBA2672620.1 hypothetical protein [Ramlibacter sp.]
MHEPFPPQEAHIVTVTLILPAHQALALAQYVTRAGFDDYLLHARDRREALQMHAAGQTLRVELARAGYALR